jgi:hypothetical protein
LWLLLDVQSDPRRTTFRERDRRKSMSDGSMRLAFPHAVACRVIQWHVSVGSPVSKDQPLVSYDTVPTSGRYLLRAPMLGNLAGPLAPDGVAIPPGSVIGRVTECDHSMVFGDMCSHCRQVIASSTLSTRKAVVQGGKDNTVMVSASHYETQSSANTLRLWQSRKLVLVLDIDHTLLHAIGDSESPWTPSAFDHLDLPLLPSAATSFGFSHGAASKSTNQLERMDPRARLLYSHWTDTHSFAVAHPKGAPSAGRFDAMHVRLRPDVRHFLSTMAPLFDLYICTAGNRAYAEQVCPPSLHLLLISLLTQLCPVVARGHWISVLSRARATLFI